ncbi:hypothetical protein GWI33_000552 [Rhynchophorus ferrugineus]|uniref:Uncharacterized protein n=1 Tax=Rhynchophorus ferrugineus TaxID=354439 RepID=A0A834MM21_RHYFE|nr:hypothetical protein GWI33_000552 [Rhynchophorus ferrugineus]
MAKRIAKPRSIGPKWMLYLLIWSYVNFKEVKSIEEVLHIKNTDELATADEIREAVAMTVTASLTAVDRLLSIEAGI